MNDAEQKHLTRFKTSIPFRPGERDRFEKFIDSTGRKVGPFLRIIVMRSVEQWEKSGDKTDEIHEVWG